MNSPPKYLNNLSEFVGDLRSLVFSSQSKAADYVHLHKTTITRYEGGQITPPLGYLACLAQLVVDHHPEDELTTYREALLKEVNRAARYHYGEPPFKDWNELCHCADRFLAERRDANPADDADETNTNKDVKQPGDRNHLIRINNYEIKELLGRGPIAEVYRAVEPTLAQDVAIKIIHTYMARDPSIVDRFRHEARLVAALRHPNIAQIYDADVEDSTFYLVMEFVPGENLQQRLAAFYARNETMPLPEAIQLFRSITQAVAYAHRRGVIHRNLKPTNVLLKDNGALALADFELSKFFGGKRFAEPGVIVGTPHYMSPEQGSGTVVDARTDIYALGVILYELTTGTLPFDGDTPVGILLKHLSETPALPCSINPNLPQAIEPIIQKALAKDPAQRFSLAHEMLEAVGRVELSIDERSLPRPAGDEERCPYRGLQTFDTQHAEFFFGREALITQLSTMVSSLIRSKDPQFSKPGLRGGDSRFLTVLGASGSGKSSLVRAGLIPALRKGALPGSDTWPILVLRPGNYPLDELAVQLVTMLDKEGDRLASTRDLADHLAADGRTLHLTMRLNWFEAPPERYLLLVIDQFEEVFTLCHNEMERQRFIENLLYAALSRGGKVMVILTMRADFYHRCASYRELANQVSAQQMLVGPMNEAELQRAIKRPAEQVGLRFEPGLVQTILTDVAQQPGALPLLQHAMLELWKRRQDGMLMQSAYQESGRVGGAIAKWAEALYAGFSPDEQLIIRQIMLQLTQPGEGTEDTRRRARKSDLVADEGQAERVEAVIQRLADARLVTTTRDMAGGEDQVDVAHEALIRGWARLQSWLDEDRADLIIHRRLTEAADEWLRHDQDEAYLYRGTRLIETEEWAARHPEALNKVELTFLEASIEERVWRKKQEEAARRKVEEAERKQRYAQEQQLRELKEEQRKQAETAARLQARTIALIVVIIAVAIIIAGLALSGA